MQFKRFEKLISFNNSLLIRWIVRSKWTKINYVESTMNNTLENIIRLEQILLHMII